MIKLTDLIIRRSKEKIAKNPLIPKDKKESALKRIIKRTIKFFGEGVGTLITSGATHCRVCGEPLTINNPNQIVLYCSKFCRRRRHNTKVA